jgi:hypothetical protein
MFDGDIAAGPVPLLFAANPDEAAASIAAEPAKAHFDLSKVTFIILISLLSKYGNLTKTQSCIISLYRLDMFTDMAHVPPARDSDSRHGKAIRERSEVTIVLK